LNIETPQLFGRQNASNVSPSGKYELFCLSFKEYLKKKVKQNVVLILDVTRRNNVPEAVFRARK
jgi:hypothetical protein